MTGQPVTARVTAARVSDVEPPEAVISLVRPVPSLPPRQAFCEQVHFFASTAVAQPWLAERPAAVVVPVATAFEIGRQLIEQRGAQGRSY